MTVWYQVSKPYFCEMVLDSLWTWYAQQNIGYDKTKSPTKQIGEIKYANAITIPEITVNACTCRDQLNSSSATLNKERNFLMLAMYYLGNIKIM